MIWNSIFRVDEFHNVPKYAYDDRFWCCQGQMMQEKSIETIFRGRECSEGDAFVSEVPLRQM